MKKIVVMVMLLTLACASVFAQNQSGGQRQSAQRSQGMGMMTCPSMAIMPPQSAMIDRIAQTLSLSDQQLTDLKAAIDENQKALTPLLKTASECTQAFSKSVMSSEYDSAKTKDLLDKAVKAESEIIAENLKVWEKIRGILTPDQLTKYQQMASSMRQGPGQRPSGGPQGQGQQGGDGMMPPPPNGGGFPGGAPPEPPSEQ